jgi:hypothetical protein
MTQAAGGTDAYSTETIVAAESPSPPPQHKNGDARLNISII